MENTASNYIKANLKLISGIIFAVMALTILTLTYFSVPPSLFPQNKIITIRPGMTVSDAAEALSDAGIIKSDTIFKVYVALVSGHRKVMSGDYLFDQPESSLRIAYRMSSGIQGIDKIRVTIFEGMSSKDIAASLKKSIPGFKADEFLSLAKAEEGYLFPDTYFFSPAAKPKDVVSLMRDTFDRKIKEAESAMKSFGRSRSDIIIMASIVERETNSPEDRRIIAGILWKRLEMGMPLQVDAPFHYLLGKDSSRLTISDLAMDSPYNLYKNTGLTPAPISNPGLQTILDTVRPIKTNYLFYLSDQDGNMHYASNHDGHVANKEKYLQ